MSYLLEISSIILAILAAFIFAFVLSKDIFKRKNHKQQNIEKKKKLGISDISTNTPFICDGMALKILNYMLKIHLETVFINTGSRLSKPFVKSNKLPEKIQVLALQAQMPKDYGNFAYREVQVRFIFAFVLFGALFASIFSYLLILIFVVLAIFLGLYLPSWAMKKEVLSRSEDLEENLPEMLDVVALGMRSGLTFDRALKIYTEHFSCNFAKECELAQQKWENGISTREQALKDLNKIYASTLFDRVITNIIRSLRFGSSLVSNLEENSDEARNLYKTKQEEKVAKAPVKMMIPTGTLILPAMLILVLGPILLELINGF